MGAAAERVKRGRSAAGRVRASAPQFRHTMGVLAVLAAVLPVGSVGFNLTVADGVGALRGHGRASLVSGKPSISEYTDLRRPAVRCQAVTLQLLSSKQEGQEARRFLDFQLANPNGPLALLALL